MGVIKNTIERMANKFVSFVVSKSSWSQIFRTGGDLSSFFSNNKVTQPYAQVPSVYKAIKAIADNIPQAELIFKNYDTEKEVFPKELVALFETPNPLMSGKDFIQAIAGFYAMYGEFFIIKQNKDGKPLSVGQAAGTQLPGELWPFNPVQFTEVTQKDVRGNDVLVSWKYKGHSFDLSEVITSRDWNPYNQFRGLSPLNPLDSMIDIDWSSLAYNRAFFDNDAAPGVVLTTEKTLNKENVERIKAAWESRHKGVSKAYRIAVMDNGLTPTSFGATHKDMDFIEQRKHSREEILGMWRVPKALFSITDDLNYATFIGQMKVFWTATIHPILRKIESALNSKIVTSTDKNVYCEFDLSNVPAYQEDLKDKVIVAKDLIAMGFTANEVNEKLQLGFTNQEWRDHWWIPFSTVKADDIPGPEQRGAADVPEKCIKSRVPPEFIQKSFLVIHGKVEDRFASAIKAYFYEQRKRALDAIKKAHGAEKKDSGMKINISASLNWQLEDENLKRMARPHLMTAIENGIKLGKEVVAINIEQQTAIEELNTRVSSFLMRRVARMTEINRTVQRQIESDIAEGVRQGETIDEIADRVRGVYNMASNRSRVIARTETTGAVNGGSDLYYKQVGVSQKEWLTASDEKVRETHIQLNGDIVPINSSFSNGLAYPGADGPAEEVINCRCTIAPVID